MLTIGVIGETLRDIEAFISVKYRGKIKEHNLAQAKWILINGDILRGCWGDKNLYNGVDFDAYVVCTHYIDLVGVIQYRASRMV